MYGKREEQQEKTKKRLIFLDLGTIFAGEWGVVAGTPSAREGEQTYNTDEGDMLLTEPDKRTGRAQGVKQGKTIIKLLNDLTDHHNCQIILTSTQGLKDQQIRLQIIKNGCEHYGLALPKISAIAHSEALKCNGIEIKNVAELKRVLENDALDFVHYDQQEDSEDSNKIAILSAYKKHFFWGDGKETETTEGKYYVFDQHELVVQAAHDEGYAPQSCIIADGEGLTSASAAGEGSSSGDSAQQPPKRKLLVDALREVQVALSPQQSRRRRREEGETKAETDKFIEPKELLWLQTTFPGQVEAITQLLENFTEAEGITSPKFQLIQAIIHLDTAMKSAVAAGQVEQNTCATITQHLNQLLTDCAGKGEQECAQTVGAFQLSIQALTGLAEEDALTVDQAVQQNARRSIKQELWRIGKYIVAGALVGAALGAGVGVGLSFAVPVGLPILAPAGAVGGAVLGVGVSLVVYGLAKCGLFGENLRGRAPRPQADFNEDALQAKNAARQNIKDKVNEIGKAAKNFSFDA